MGTIMKSKRTSHRSAVRAGIRRAGEGSAWLIFDPGGALFQYQCYWKGGHCDDHLIEHARVATDAEAVDWAAARTSRARIRIARPSHLLGRLRPQPERLRRHLACTHRDSQPRPGTRLGAGLIGL